MAHLSNNRRGPIAAAAAAAVVGVAVSVAAILAAAGCAPRAASSASPRPPAGDGLDFFLLAAAPATTLAVEVDRVEGLAGPSDVALAALRETLAAATGKRVEIDAGGVVPLDAWEDGPREPEALAGRVAGWLDADPTRRAEREVLYVLYAPRAAGSALHGWFARAPARGEGGKRAFVPAAFVFEEAIREEAALWVGAEKIERRALVHEAGHALGLPADTGHAVPGDPRHCAVSGCAMEPSRRGADLRDALRALGGRVPWRFCARCRADLDAARARFAAEARDPERLRERIRRRESEELFGSGSAPGARISPDGG